MTITPTDFAVLQSLLKCEIARYWKNPTTYYSNLYQRAFEIILEHVSETAKPVENTPSYHP